MSHEHLPNTIKNVGDAISVAAVLATLNDWLPPLAALATLVWTCLRIADWFSERQEKASKKVKESGNAKQIL